MTEHQAQVDGEEQDPTQQPVDQGVGTGVEAAAAEQMPGAKPRLDSLSSTDIKQHSLKGAALSEELAPVRTADQVEVVMTARQAHVEEATPVMEEVAQTPSKEPWWKQIFAAWSRDEEAAEVPPKAEPGEVIEDGLPLEGALPAESVDQLPLEAAQEGTPTWKEDSEAAAPASWWRRLLVRLQLPALPYDDKPSEPPRFTAEPFFISRST